jgi:hypothetical protein
MHWISQEEWEDGIDLPETGGRVDWWTGMFYQCMRDIEP